MVFKLLQRFGSSAKRVDKDKDKDNPKSSNNGSTAAASHKSFTSYSKKRSAAMAGIALSPSSDTGVFVPSTAPRLDLSITRTPSPPLVEVPLEGYRTNSPWVDLAAEAQKPARPGSFGFGSAPRAGSSSPTPFGSSPPRTVVNDKLQSYLDEKRVTVKHATVLVRECSKVLQRQGIETLGIFRPWRLAESPYIVARTLALFLRAVCPEDKVPLDDRDLLGFGNDDTLVVFVEALEDAGTHNVVGCLKWTLRHLSYGTSGFAASTVSDPWHFYTQFIGKDSEADYPRDAFREWLLKAVPSSHAELLLECMEMVASVAAHDAQNAMPGLHLCRLLAFWFFGLQYQTYQNFTSLYLDYRVASSCLEHIFLAYLRSEDKLPLRLADMVSPSYPPQKMHITSNELGRPFYSDTKWETLHVVLSSTLNESRLQKKRSTPGAVIASALRATSGEKAAIQNELNETWTTLAAKSASGEAIDLQTILADETDRIFGVLAEKVQAQKSRTILRAWQVPAGNDGRQGRRRRSASFDVGAMPSRSSKSSTSSHRRTRALSNDARMLSSPTQAIDMSWGDFETKGFADDFDSDTFSLFSEVGRPSTDAEEGGAGDTSRLSSSHQHNKLKKPYPYASLASRHLQPGRLYLSDAGSDNDLASSDARISTMQVQQIDPIFAEVYLDALGDSSITAQWPIFVLAEIKNAIIPYKAVLVEVQQEVTNTSQVITEGPNPTSSPVMGSTAAGTSDSKKKRGFLSLSKRRRVSQILTRSLSQERRPTSTLHEVSELGELKTDSQSESQETPPTKSTSMPAISEAPEKLPSLPRNMTVPTIIKTSPLTPPRHSYIRTLPHAEEEDESQTEEKPILPSSASTSTAETDSRPSTGRKLSRKAVPQLEEEDPMADDRAHAQHTSEQNGARMAIDREHDTPVVYDDPVTEEIHKAARTAPDAASGKPEEEAAPVLLHQRDDVRVAQENSDSLEDHDSIPDPTSEERYPNEPLVNNVPATQVADQTPSNDLTGRKRDTSVTYDVPVTDEIHKDAQVLAPNAASKEPEEDEMPVSVHIRDGQLASSQAPDSVEDNEDTPDSTPKSNLNEPFEIVVPTVPSTQVPDQELPDGPAGRMTPTEVQARSSHVDADPVRVDDVNPVKAKATTSPQASPSDQIIEVVTAHEVEFSQNMAAEPEREMHHETVSTAEGKYYVSEPSQVDDIRAPRASLDNESLRLEVPHISGADEAKPSGSPSNSTVARIDLVSSIPLDTLAENATRISTAPAAEEHKIPASPEDSDVQSPLVGIHSEAAALPAEVALVSLEVEHTRDSHVPVPSSGKVQEEDAREVRLPEHGEPNLPETPSRSARRTISASLSSVEPAPAPRFGHTLNRVSPSLKARLGLDGKAMPFSDAVKQEEPIQSKPRAPPSPSKRAALLSGAKRILSRKKSGPASPDPQAESTAVQPAVPMLLNADLEAISAPQTPKHSHENMVDSERSGTAQNVDADAQLATKSLDTPSQGGAVEETVSESKPPSAAELDDSGTLSRPAAAAAALEPADERAEVPLDTSTESEGGYASDKIEDMYKNARTPVSVLAESDEVLKALQLSEETQVGRNVPIGDEQESDKGMNDSVSYTSEGAESAHPNSSKEDPARQDIFGLIDASAMPDDKETSGNMEAPEHMVVDVPPISQHPTPAETPFDSAVEEQAAFNLPALADTVSNVREVATSAVTALAGAAGSVLPTSLATLVGAEQPKTSLHDASDGDNEGLPVDKSYPNAFDDTPRGVRTSTSPTVNDEMDDNRNAPATVDNDTQDEKTAEGVEKDEHKDTSSYKADEASTPAPEMGIESHAAPVMPLTEENSLTEKEIEANASDEATPMFDDQNTPAAVADYSTHVPPVPISPISQTATLDDEALQKANDLEDEHRKSKTKVETGSQPPPLHEHEPALHMDGTYEKRTDSLPAVKAREVQDEAFNKIENDHALEASQVNKSPLPTFTYEDVDSISPSPLIHLEQSPPSAAISATPSSMLDPLLTLREATTDDELAEDHQEHVGGVVDEDKQASVKASDTKVTKTPTEEPAHSDSPTRTAEHTTEIASSGDAHDSRSKHVELEPTPVASCAPLTTQHAVESKPSHPTVAHE